MSTTVKLFTDLGLTLNTAKSVLIPSQSISFLGFVLNSAQMTVALTPSNAMKVKSKAVELLHNQSPTIRTVSEMIGLMVASFPGVMYGPLYYRQLEIEKVIALKQNQGNFEATWQHGQTWQDLTFIGGLKILLTHRTLLCAVIAKS